MATPEPLDANVEDLLIAHDTLWRRLNPAPGTPEAAIRDHFRTYVVPQTTKLTTTVQVVSSALRSADGIWGPRYQRTCKELWRRPEALTEDFGLADSAA